MAQSQQQNHENLRAKQNHRAVRSINTKQAARKRHAQTLQAFARAVSKQQIAHMR